MQKNLVKNFVLPALNLLGVFLIVLGVFIFANVLSKRSFSVGDLRLPSDPATAVAAIACGLFLFGAATVVGKILKRKL